MSAVSPVSEDTASLIARGAGLHTAGRLDEAAALYRSILDRSPQNFDAMHLLGVVALQQGQYDRAQRLIGDAVAIRPRDAAAIGNFGATFMGTGQVACAYEWYSVALLLQPESPYALLNVGSALLKLSRHVEAIPVLRNAFSADPNSYEICARLGEALVGTGAMREGADMFEFATLADPHQADGWMQLATVLTLLGEHQEALECSERARSLGSLPAISPVSAAGGNEPTAHVLSQTGYALIANGFEAEGIAQLGRALQLEPHNLTARMVMAIANLKSTYLNGADVALAREGFSRAIDEVMARCQDAGVTGKAYEALGVATPFSLAYQPFNNRDLLMRYGRLCTRLMGTLPLREARTRTRTERFRIGIASPHIKSHSVWNAITKGWVDHIDPRRFDIHLFQLNRDADAETLRVRQRVAAFEDRPADLQTWAERIRASDLDVLIYPSVGMDAPTQQLGALRLAPVQAAGWGHPETTGLPSIDLYLSAEAFESPCGSEHYSERLIRLPNLGVYVDPLEPPSTQFEPRSLGLPDDQPLLLCPGTPFKYLPFSDEVWVGIARGLREGLFKRKVRGRLVFFRSVFEAMDRAFEARLRAAFDQAGLQFDAHASIVPNLERPVFYALMGRAALMLDTVDFSGFNTALQGIECNLPVLAYEGEFMRGRLGSGIMHRLGLPELVASTKQQFVEKAIDLAHDAGKRATASAAIAQRRSILFRDLTPVRALEQHLIEEIMRTRS